MVHLTVTPIHQKLHFQDLACAGMLHLGLAEGCIETGCDSVLRFCAVEEAEFVLFDDHWEVVADEGGGAVESDHCFVLEGEVFPDFVAVHLPVLTTGKPVPRT